MAISMNGGKAAGAAAAPKKEMPAGFLKTGAAAKQAQTEAAAKAEAAKAEAGKLWRFRINADDTSDHRITFLDGSLDEDGALDVVMWHEHTLQLGGKWKNVPCTAHEEPCPICANGENPDLVAGLTVIDHTPFTIKSGPNAGKTVQQSKKLFIAKRTTFAALQKLASKKGGLVGTSWDVSRNGEKSAAVGDMFDHVATETLANLKKTYGELAEPANMAEELTYYTRAELIQQGVKGGAVPTKVGGMAPSKDLDEELGG